jgi:hypothetical protein
MRSKAVASKHYKSEGASSSALLEGIMKKLLGLITLAFILLSMPAPHVDASGYETVLYLGGNGNLDQTYTLWSIFDAPTPAPVYDAGYDMILGSSPSGANGTGVRMRWTDPRTINYVRMCWTANKTRTGGTDRQEFFVNGIRVADFYIPNALGVNTGCIAASIVPSTNVEYLISGSVRSNVSNQGGAYVLSDGSYYRITLIELSVLNEDPELTIPVPAAQRTYEYNHPATNISLAVTGTTHNYTNVSASAGAPVYAPEAVRVTGMERLSFTGCQTYMGKDFTCAIVVPSSVTGGSQANLYTVLTGFNLNTDIFIVFLRGSGDYDYSYIVANPNVIIGQDIDSSCYFGETFSAGSNGAAQAVVFEGLTSVDSEEWFTVEPPSNGSPCSAPPSYEQCIGNAIVNRPEEWTEQSGVTWLADRVIIQPGGYISKVMLLDLDSDPAMYAYGRGVGGTASATLSMIAVDDVDVGISQGADFRSEFVERGIRLEGETGVTEVRVRFAHRDGGIPIELKSICITADESPNPEFSCTFDDYEMDVADSWTITNGTWKSGEIRLNDGGTVSQTVDLAAGDWYLNVSTTIISKATYIIDATNTTDGLIWEYNVGAGWVALDTITEADYAFNNNRVVSEVMFNLASPYSGLFQIRVTLQGTPEFSAAIGHACLSDSQYTEGGGYLFPQRCGISYPAPTGTESVGVWTQWLWVNLWEFYECDLMVLLNNMYQLGVRWYETFGWSIRYSQRLIDTTFYWLDTQVFPWLNGHFANIATGGNTTTIVAGNTCDNLFCTILGLGELIIAPIQSLIDGVIGAVNRVFDVLETVLAFLIDALQVILDAIDAALLFLIDALYSLLSGFENTGTFIIDALYVILEALQDLFYFLLDILGRLFTIIEAVFVLLIDIVRLLIDTANGLIQYLLAMMNDVRNLFATLLNMWNTTPPATLPFVPSCTSNPQGNGMCIAFWMMEHTIFSGTGALFIPLIISFGSILALLWAARKLKTAIHTAGGLI